LKILVTGGAGFIGSNLVKRLLALGHVVWTIDDLSTGSKTYLQEVADHPNHTFIHGSTLQRKLLQKWIGKVDLVYHLAAVLGVKNTVDHPLEVIEGNIDGTRNVLELAYRRKCKVVFTSTSEIYGKNNQLPFDEMSDRVLGASSIHRWCYATAKALDEHMCFAYANKGLPVTILRYFNAYGPGQINSQYGMVVPRFIQRALTGQPLEVYGDGLQTRCFTFVDDMVSGTVAAMKPEANGKAFNIGSNQPIAIKTLARLIIQLCNSESDMVYKSYQEAYGASYEDTPDRIPDLTRSTAILKFQSTVSLPQGLGKTIAWHQHQGVCPAS